MIYPTGTYIDYSSRPFHPTASHEQKQIHLHLKSENRKSISIHLYNLDLKVEQTDEAWSFNPEGKQNRKLVLEKVF